MRFGVLQFASLLLVLTALGAEQAPAPTTAVFPLARGSYWVYEGDVTYNLTPNQVTTATMRRRMQVEDVISGADFRAALIKGGPWDLALYANGKPAGDYLIVTISDATYFAEGEQAREIFKTLHDMGLTHEVRDTLAENVWFRTPLHPNGIYCPPDQLGRDDRMYCWSVMATKSDRVAAVKGVKAEARTVYELAFRTSPDSQTVSIVPGIGIIHYTYSHHGTPSEVDVKLVEYHPGK